MMADPFLSVNRRGEFYSTTIAPSATFWNSERRDARSFLLTLPVVCGECVSVRLPALNAIENISDKNKVFSGSYPGSSLL
jgi:hypothetical protein